MILAFHKPYGVLCQFTRDQPGQRTLADFNFPKDVYPLGRLDMDSEGLLLLSDEAGLNNRLLDPKHSHPRTYLVQIEGEPSEASMRKLCSGAIIIQKHRCLPCEAGICRPQPDIAPRIPPIRIRKSIPDTWIEITLIEGKNRQVRRMTAAIGHPTLRLIRVHIANFSDDSLEPGTWRRLEMTEISRLGI